MPASAPRPLGSYDTPEYRLSNGATAAGAMRAYDQGWSGAGIKIGVIDSGIDRNFVDFSGRIDAASRDAAGSRNLLDEDGHGTAVSAIAAAARNDQYQHGVAPGASIVAVRADTVGSCGASGGCAFTDAALASGVETAHGAGATVINLSIAGSAAGPRLVAAVDAATKDGVVVVVAAGNAGATSAGAQPQGVAADLARLAGNGLVIIAGSVGVPVANTPDEVDLSRLSSFSNRAGNSAAAYLAALGHRVVAPNVLDGHKPYYWTGTSFSAPVISGAVALLAQAFPELSGQKIVEILYKTADDLGATGADDVFGRGRLNLDRAFRPIGTTGLAGSGAPISLFDNGQLPTTAGDARPASAGAVILDEYARPFRLDVAQTVGAARRDDARLARALGAGLSRRAARAGSVTLALAVAERSGEAPPSALDLAANGAERARILAGHALARLDDATAVALGFAEGVKGLERELAGAGNPAGYLHAADPLAAEAFAVSREGSVALRRELGGLAVTASAEAGRALDADALADRGRYVLSAATVDAGLAGLRVSLGASRLDEADTVLGGRLAPALAAAGATTHFADAEVAGELGGSWSGRLQVRRGWTAFAGDDGRLGSGAWAAEFAKTGLVATGDRLGLRLSQPLRIGSGGLATRLPDSYDWRTGDVTYARQMLGFVPRGRELAGEASYGLNLAGGSLTANAFWRREPGHREAAADDVGAAIRFGVVF